MTGRRNYPKQREGTAIVSICVSKHSLITHYCRHIKVSFPQGGTKPDRKTSAEKNRDLLYLILQNKLSRGEKEPDMISDLALEQAEMTAREVGFGPRDDYPFLGESAVSAGDWKGHSVIACVFADCAHADRFVGQCLEDLDDLGGELSGQVFSLDISHGGDMYCAVVNGMDLMHKSETKSGC